MNDFVQTLVSLLSLVFLLAGVLAGELDYHQSAALLGHSDDASSLVLATSDHEYHAHHQPATSEIYFKLGHAGAAHDHLSTGYEHAVHHYP